MNEIVHVLKWQQVDLKTCPLDWQCGSLTAELPRPTTIFLFPISQTIGDDLARVYSYLGDV